LTSINGEKAIDSQLPGGDRTLLAEVTVMEHTVVPEPNHKKKKGEKKEKKNPLTDQQAPTL
jgi:hypothetical protein